MKSGVERDDNLVLSWLWNSMEASIGTYMLQTRLPPWNHVSRVHEFYENLGEYYSAFKGKMMS